MTVFLRLTITALIAAAVYMAMHAADAQGALSTAFLVGAGLVGLINPDGLTTKVRTVRRTRFERRLDRSSDYVKAIAESVVEQDRR